MKTFGTHPDTNEDDPFSLDEDPEKLENNVDEDIEEGPDESSSGMDN